MDDIKLTFHKASTETELAIPLAQSSVKAGFPSPAQDYMIEGDSMMDAGILDGDLAVVDKSLDASDGDFVIAFVDGDFTIKQFRLDASGNSGWLVPWNKRYPRIEVKSGEDFRIWGVVTYVIHAIHGLKTKYHVRNNP